MICNIGLYYKYVFLLVTPWFFMSYSMRDAGILNTLSKTALTIFFSWYKVISISLQPRLWMMIIKLRLKADTCWSLACWEHGESSFTQCIKGMILSIPLSSNYVLIDNISMYHIFLLHIEECTHLFLEYNFNSEKEVFYCVLSWVTLFNFAVLCELQNSQWKIYFIAFLFLFILEHLVNFIFSWPSP